MPSTLGTLPASLRTCLISNKKSRLGVLRNPYLLLKTLRSKEGRARDLKVRGKAQPRVAKSRKRRKRAGLTKMVLSKSTPPWIGRVGAEPRRKRWR